MKILVIDGHPVVWHGICQLFSTDPDALVLHAPTADLAISAAQLESPDVYLLDTALDGRGGLDILKKIRKQRRLAHVLMFSPHVDVTLANSAIRAGACGYLTKGASREDLRQAIERVSVGKPFVDQLLVHEIVKQYADIHLTESTLDDREKKMLRLLSKGRKIKDIAFELGVAPKTVSNALTRVKDKLHIPKASRLLHHSVEWDAHRELTRRL